MELRLICRKSRLASTCPQYLWGSPWLHLSYGYRASLYTPTKLVFINSNRANCYRTLKSQHRPSVLLRKPGSVASHCLETKPGLNWPNLDTILRRMRVLLVAIFHQADQDLDFLVHQIFENSIWTFLISIVNFIVSSMEKFIDCIVCITQGWNSSNKKLFASTVIDLSSVTEFPKLQVTWEIHIFVCRLIPINFKMH